MHNTATFIQRRYNTELTDDAAYRYQVARATPALDVADFVTLLRTDKLAAAQALAGLDAQKLVVQALCHATWLNETYGFGDSDLVTTEEVLQNFERGIAVYRSTRVEI